MPKNPKNSGGKKKAAPAQPSCETDPDFFTWGIIYIAKDRRFQCHVLESDEENGVVGLKEAIGEDNIILTESNRLKGYRIKYADSHKSYGDKVYLFCTVRKGKWHIFPVAGTYKKLAKSKTLAASSRYQCLQD